MFSYYKLKDKQIIIYVDMKMEASMFKSGKKYSFKESVIDFLKKKKLTDVPLKVVIVASGIVIATLIFTREYPKEASFSQNNNQEIYRLTYVETSQVVKPLAETKETVIKEDQLKEIVNKETMPISNKALTEVSNHTLVKEEKEYEEKIGLQEIKEEVVNNTEKTNYSDSTNEPVIETKVLEDNNLENEVATSNTLEPHKQTSEDSNNKIITVNRSDNSVINLELEQYLIGVVSAEMPASFNIEALKAQAIVARTYALRKVVNNKSLTDTVLTQAYIDTTQMKQKWGNDFQKYYDKIEKAVMETAGQTIMYQGKYIDAVYHAVSNGKTRAAVSVWGYEIPYLQSVDSHDDENTTQYLKTVMLPMNDVLKKLELTEKLNISSIMHDVNNYVETITINDVTYSGRQMREIFNLRSTDFAISLINDEVFITTKGYGHGVGMSQYGANELAKKGYSYEQILRHYYKGITLNVN